MGVVVCSGGGGYNVLEPQCVGLHNEGLVRCKSYIVWEPLYGSCFVWKLQCVRVLVFAGCSVQALQCVRVVVCVSWGVRELRFVRDAECGVLG